MWAEGTQLAGAWTRPGRIYSGLNETLRRGGKYKNGAIVLHLDASHPDIEEFVTAKNNMTALTDFNISVGVTDKFMTAVKKGTDFDLDYGKLVIIGLCIYIAVQVSWNRF